ncbi:acyl-CoA thioesterase [Bacillaceae bacterium Marseille-Q3522]|nr:acyl-CoA thioesterase [Bacillaceae bacterium Marseille-Q3522]
MYQSKREIQLYYADTDMMGVIYHANYLKYFEMGRAGFIEDLGFDYLAMEKNGYYAPVYNVEVTYKKPLHYGDKAYVYTWIEKNDGIRTIYGYHIVNEKEEICAKGTTTHILVKKDTFRPATFKKAFPEWYQKYEEIKKKEEL